MARKKQPAYVNVPQLVVHVPHTGVKPPTHELLAKDIADKLNRDPLLVGGIRRALGDARFSELFYDEVFST